MKQKKVEYYASLLQVLIYETNKFISFIFLLTICVNKKNPFIDIAGVFTFIDSFYLFSCRNLETQSQSSSNVLGVSMLLKEWMKIVTCALAVLIIFVPVV